MYRNICKKFQVLVPVVLILVGLGLAHGQPASAANPPPATQSDSAVIPTCFRLEHGHRQGGPGGHTRRRSHRGDQTQ